MTAFLNQQKLISKGSYGCTVNPPYNNFEEIIIPYKDKSKNDIGKIYKTSNDAKNEFYSELKILLKIQEIDKNNIFTVKLKGANLINKNNINSTSIRHCIFSHNTVSNDNDNDNDMCYQIILENGGDIIHHIKKISFLKFIKMFKNFLIGIKLLHDNNLIHNDMHELNILISNKKLNLIDFGLSRNIDTFFSKNNHNWGTQHLYFPPELFICYHLYNYKDDKELFIKKLVILFNSKILKKFIYEYNDGSHTDMAQTSNSIKSFISNIILNNKGFDDVYNKELVYKKDVYSLSYFIFYIIKYNKDTYTTNELSILYEIFYMMHNQDPFKRSSISELISYIDKIK